MPDTDPLPFGLIRYRITSKADERRFSIVASNTGTAWRKFVEQHFGALKPSRDEYRNNGYSRDYVRDGREKRR